MPPGADTRDIVSVVTQRREGLARQVVSDIGMQVVEFALTPDMYYENKREGMLHVVHEDAPSEDNGGVTLFEFDIWEVLAANHPSLAPISWTVPGFIAFTDHMDVTHHRADGRITFTAAGNTVVATLVVDADTMLPLESTRSRDDKTKQLMVCEWAESDGVLYPASVTYGGPAMAYAFTTKSFKLLPPGGKFGLEAAVPQDGQMLVRVSDRQIVEQSTWLGEWRVTEPPPPAASPADEPRRLLWVYIAVAVVLIAMLVIVILSIRGSRKAW